MKPYSRGDRGTLALTCTDLIDLIDTTFPARTPEPGESEHDIGVNAGQRALIDALKEWRQDGTNRFRFGR